MKILLLQDYLRSGGTERQSIALTRSFRDAGHDASLVTFRPGGALVSSAAELPVRVLQPVDLHLDWCAPGLLREVRRAAPDVVVCMGRMANCWGGSVQSALRCEAKAAPVIATMRTGKPLPWLFRRSLRRVAHVVANSREAGEKLTRDYGVPADRITVIHNALIFPDTTSASPLSRDEHRARLGAAPGDCVLLWVGMFRPEKNQRAMIEMAAGLPAEARWHLWFAGDGPERAACEALARRLGIAGRVRFLGFQADPTALYQAADVAVLTSRSESLSNFLIEAHAHGLPSVSYAATGVTECGGWVVPMDDPRAFLLKLSVLVQDPRVRAREGARLSGFARQQFSPEKQATAYLRLFGELIGRS